MPSKPSKKKPSALPPILKELIDQMVSGPMTAEAVNAASMAFKKALIERALGAELSHHLGYAPGAKPEGAGNHRNGASGKTVLTAEGPLRIDVPRDRHGRFEHLLIAKHERRFTGFDDKIVAKYARGMNLRPSRLFALLTAILIAVAAQVGAAPLRDVAAVPQLNAHGEQGYRQFLAAPLPRAFAIAPGGAWGMSVEAGSADLAKREALANCQANSAQRCLLYARDLDVVLDSADWVRAWGPYKSAAQARNSLTGTALGSRFPDLAFADAQGKPVKLSDLRGKVVVLHFWGSWCPPCQREMPELARLASRLKKTKDIRFVLLQVREDFASARRWASKFGPALPLYDSGMQHSHDNLLKLADGGHLSDRDVAMAFPTTYVIDKHGIVVFAHVGPLAKWEQYLAFLRDAAARSGK